ncbi:antitoxin VbhA family protein [Polynucleobacter antarcticus]|uniref:Antitoxin VbhA domain-containing protein n=1 Tax=Polynucleobacter antarcticus TaxID=1743162 RepID=A0A6M9Q4Q7_9BURK|nr:antitoxin VbhA family protein [Polynucleobacter antarcticus]QKM63523.1 hypothetical protein DCO16_11030 [Polynucleobacter antarcticus]
MKTNSEIANRKKIVSGAIGSLRIEGFKPTEIIIQELDNFIFGNKTIEQIIQETKERYRKA